MADGAPAPAGPPADCALCPRLAAFRGENRAARPDWHNAPVASEGPLTAAVLVLGLAPGLAGGNRTGRPFFGDHSGTALRAALADAGLAPGRACGAAVRIANAVACVPPGNRPTAAEIAACRPYLAAEIAAMPALGVVLCLGRVAHDSLFRALGTRPPGFAHGARHPAGRLTVFDSYHPSRLNMNTGRLTPAMLSDVLADVLATIRGTMPGGLNPMATN